MEDKLIAALVALVGVVLVTLVNLFLSFRNAKALRKQPFLEKQLELCLEATTVAASLASATDREIFEKAEQRFWELFLGPLAVVENNAIASEMAGIATAVEAYNQTGRTGARDELEGRALMLANHVRRLILEVWEITSVEKVLHPRRRVSADSAVRS